VEPEKYPTQVQQLVFMMDRLSAQLEHMLIHQLPIMLRIVLLALLIVHVLVDLPHLFLALLVNM